MMSHLLSSGNKDLCQLKPRPVASWTKAVVSLWWVIRPESMFNNYLQYGDNSWGATSARGLDRDQLTWVSSLTSGDWWELCMRESWLVLNTFNNLSTQHGLYIHCILLLLHSAGSSLYRMVIDAWSQLYRYMTSPSTALLKVILSRACNVQEGFRISWISWVSAECCVSCIHLCLRICAKMLIRTFCNRLTVLLLPQ